MRQLIVMRHAKSDRSIPGLADHDRPLNQRGRKTAPAMGRFLSAQGIAPDVVYCSTATRVRQTVDLLASQYAQQMEVIFGRELYLAPLESLKGHVAGLHATWKSAMLIGHNPGLSDFISALTRTHVELPTAAVAVLRTPADSWLEAIRSDEWTLEHEWKPKEIDAVVNDISQGNLSK